jgi:23S rRNA pseudouridine1911/1915/1917 synthase
MNDLKIIYQDDRILAVDKPVGVVVNISETSSEGTLQEAFIPLINKSDNPESEFNKRSGIVHRLDKDTSGVLVVARDEEAFSLLQKQFKERQVVKEYLALVHGKIDEEVFEVNAPIKRNPRNRFKYAVVKEGKEAVTRFEKEKEMEKEGEVVTLLRTYPLTGRTHQIRVHLVALGHPVVGDELYSSKKQRSKWQEIYGRMMLHAASLSITHPFTGETLRLEAPIPSEFK